MQTALFKIWTRVVESSSDNDNLDAMNPFIVLVQGCFIYGDAAFSKKWAEAKTR